MSESSNAKSPCENLFPSLISDIKSYNGMDPLLPWLRGIKKMKETLPPQLLKEKLPRFLQKCAQTFKSDRRYSNDLRYLRVWLQLMDFVDPKAVLKTMEMNRIGMKKSLFYQAYALYYEKMKKFDAAEKIYHLGVQNLAEPVDELQKSYEQFLLRQERTKIKRIQLPGGKMNKGRLNCVEVRNCKENTHRNNGQPADMLHKDHSLEPEAEFVNIVNEVSRPSSWNAMPVGGGSNHKQMAATSCNIGVLDEELSRKVLVSDSGVEVKVGKDDNKNLCGNDTGMVRFVDTAIVGKSKAEDARHHGLVEPTINTKEAMNAINDMFREPLEPSISGRTSRKHSGIGSNMENGFKIFTDGSSESQHNSLQVPSPPQLKRPDTNQLMGESFEIYVDGEETVDVKEKVKGNPAQDSDTVNVYSNYPSVFARPNDHPSECLKDPKLSRPIQAGLREDTVVYRFVGSTISDEPEVENVWHHGLVDPTVNLKEAMKDINSMFGKPIEFTRKRRPRKHHESPDVKVQGGEFLILPDDDDDDDDDQHDTKAASSFSQKPLNMPSQCNPESRNNYSGFLILPDDELDNQEESSVPSSSTRNDSGLFEQTVFTKEAMADINKLFAMPMDF